MSDILLEKQSKAFVDISLAFESNPITGDLTVIKNERAINAAIRNLILTKPGEIPFNSEFGSHVSDYLFEFIDEGTAGLISLEIERVISIFEPRVELVDVYVEAQPDQHQLVANIKYKIVGYEQIISVSEILRPTRL